MSKWDEHIGMKINIYVKLEAEREEKLPSLVDKDLRKRTDSKVSTC